MTYFKVLLQAAGLTLLISGCQSKAEQHPIKAKIVQHDASSRAEIAAIISAALGTQQIQLGNALFLNTNKLVVQRKQQRNLQQGVINGRDHQVPSLFLLSIENGQCKITLESSNKSWPLKRATCVPLSDD
ncbi:hypothetical protein [Aliikangiella sp. IMCC44632]